MIPHHQKNLLIINYVYLFKLIIYYINIKRGIGRKQRIILAQGTSFLKLR